jgi:hypothetical protein
LDDWQIVVQLLTGAGEVFPLPSIQLPIRWVSGTLSLWVKQLGQEDDHSPPCIAKVPNVWSYTSTLRYVFVAFSGITLPFPVPFTVKQCALNSGMQYIFTELY